MFIKNCAVYLSIEFISIFHFVLKCSFQTLQSEFTQQENLLRELESDAELFHEQKKLEAAERLEQQIALLKVVTSVQA